MSDALPTTSTPYGQQSGAPRTTPSDRKARKEHTGVRRRNRLITSCLECRRRKLKCNKQQTCNNCIKFSCPCVFISQDLDPEAQAKLAEVKEKMGMLEKTLEEDISRKERMKQSSKSPSASYGAPALPGQDQEYSDHEEEDLNGVGPSHLGIHDITYHEDEGNDDIVDLGISIGKLRITERIGGLVRPKFSEETPNPFAGQSPSAWMAPGNEFVAPSSSFFFGPGVEKMSLMTYLPSRSLVDKLMANYWEVVHIITHTVHRPSFERQYEAFWQSITSGVEPRMSFQAVVFATLLSSIVSMPEDKVLAEFGVAKQPLVDNFQQGTEAALAKANFLRTTKLETLQAFVMYLIPLCRAEVSRAHSALTGTCIRLAECMGLHRDPTSYTTNPIEIQIRRLIWFHIGFLDIRTCESTGPRPQIRRDEFDTRFPLNVDDVTLQQAVDRGEQVTEDSKHFTDMTITRMRFECYEMHRVMWTERPKISQLPKEGEKKTTVTSLLSRIQAFKSAMEKTYLPMLSKNNPQHVIAMEMYSISSTRLYINVLHPFASSDRHKMPERLRSIMISACIMIVEHSMNIEQQPCLKQWSWYLGALHQYHVALLLTTEMYRKPSDPVLLDRMWRCIDYSFDLPPDLDRIEKLRMVLKELSDRCGAYATMRRMRAPTDMAGPASSQKAPSQQSRRDGSFSDPSGNISHTMGGSPSTLLHQVPYQQQAPPQQHQYNPPSLPAKGPLGSMPQVEWGNFDMGTADPLPPVLTPEIDLPYDFASFVPTAPATPASDLLNVTNAGVGSDMSNSPPAPGMAGGSGGSGFDTSPLAAAINDIDWNEWEQLFGSAEMGAGNLMIPPFTFPSFEPSDLQWSNQ
ncbi:hypothetical protein K458DRAFT_441962 [Lentithecium fluviatile CBS 122367]|uniref:Zn(2)-C6 fungal-type domain-containing protein n=1 Tax=Lentithecium fluviatile CBS 122367 TaxID=1168545 RepID=A0A6G1J5K9_9PLEO|nr:hypothetical protein K458DRAFT_441962 [Lentithecium fluviatile CBS 122367]